MLLEEERKVALKTHVVRSALWTATQVGGVQLTSFLVFLVLTRLLSAHDIGLVALAAAFIDIITPITRGGLPEALIQRETPTELQADTCFWATIIAALAMASGLVFSAELAVAAFNLPELGPVLRWLALLLPITALSATHEARISRDFGHKALALRSLAASILSGVVGLALAFNGFGVWSLVAQRIVSSVLSTILVWVMYRWVPEFRFSNAEFRTMVRFGVHMVGSAFLWIVNGRIIDFVAAFFMGPEAVGFIRVALRSLEMVTQLTITPLVSIALPALSRIQQDPAAFDRAFRKFTQTSALVAFPAYFGLAAVAGDLVPLVFGNQWAFSGSLLPILCFSAIPMTIQLFTWPALASVGRADSAAMGGAIVVGISVLVTALAAPYGILFTVTANVVRGYLTLPVALILLRRHTGVQFKQLFQSLLLPLAGALLMALCVYGFGLVATASPSYLRLTLSIALGAISYALFIYCFARQILVEFRIALRRPVA